MFDCSKTFILMFSAAPGRAPSSGMCTLLGAPDHPGPTSGLESQISCFFQQKNATQREAKRRQAKQSNAKRSKRKRSHAQKWGSRHRLQGALGVSGRVAAGSRGTRWNAAMRRGAWSLACFASAPRGLRGEGTLEISMATNTFSAKSEKLL